MAVLVGDIPKQWCAHQTHDGGMGPDGIPASRSIWPLHGFDESVKAYKARLDRAIAQTALPDLSDLEVQQ